MAGDSDEGTGDRVRDAIVAQGKAEQAARDEYEAAVAQERELFARGRRHALWQPPDEQEFNGWFTPLDALEVSDERMADDHDKWEIAEKLKAGQILAVARTAQIRGDLVGVQPFVHIHGGVWRRMDQTAEHYFWKTGHLVVTAVEDGRLTGGKERYFDVRFDPETFSGKPPPHLPDEAPKQSALPPNKGGAPRKGWWDDLWIEMIRRIKADELHPESGKQLERIMLDWLGQQGIYPGDETLKKTALKLFKYLNE